jgi:hypothetical protein
VGLITLRASLLYARTGWCVIAKQWAGKSYDEDWFEVDNRGVRTTGVKDLEADHANQAMQSPWQSQAPAPVAPPASGLNTDTERVLREQMTAPITVNQNDPAYQQAVSANRFNLDRTADRQRAAMAQRRAATGTATGGGLQTDVERILNEQGAKGTQFEADLLRAFREQNDQRQQRALALSTGLLGQDKQGALTREGYGLQERLGMADLNLRRDSLAQQLGLSEAAMNQQAMLALLGV